MKYGAGGSLFQIAVAAMEITILINSTRNVPTRAFLAFPKIVLIANESEIAVLIQTTRRIIIGAGLMLTISRRKAAATRRNITMETNAESRKSK
jgi:hypothetical protein